MRVKMLRICRGSAQHRTRTGRPSEGQRSRTGGRQSEAPTGRKPTTHEEPGLLLHHETTRTVEPLKPQAKGNPGQVAEVALAGGQSGYGL